jgi:hypothetical protein
MPSFKLREKTLMNAAAALSAREPCRKTMIALDGGLPQFDPRCIKIRQPTGPKRRRQQRLTPYANIAKRLARR